MDRVEVSSETKVAMYSSLTTIITKINYVHTPDDLSIQMINGYNDYNFMKLQELSLSSTNPREGVLKRSQFSSFL